MIWLLFRQYWEKLGNLLFQHLVTLFIISLSLSHVANPSLRSRCPLLLKEFFEEAIEQLDPANQVEKQYLLFNVSQFCILTLKFKNYLKLINRIQNGLGKLYVYWQNEVLSILCKIRMLKLFQNI